MNTLERAFRSKDPSEIEKTLRDMVNVRVAVVDSIKDLEEKVNNNCYPFTVTVPYGVFLGKIKERDLDVYLLDLQRVKEAKAIERIRASNITPNATYVLLSSVAGYSENMGLAFDGVGETTGFRPLDEAEKAEKNDIGRKQSWEEHATGTKKRAERILGIYRPFIGDWCESVFRHQNRDENSARENANALILAIKISALFHDLGKLRREWQEAVGWRIGEPYIARTEERHKVPFHAPYAYPFLRKLLRSVFGDFRILDTIALAATRHHSLEVSGFVRSNTLELADKTASEFLYGLFSHEFPELADTDYFEKAFMQSIEEAKKGSLMDEPPSPSDDFYFIYVLANRVVKFADWEDACDSPLELSDL